MPTVTALKSALQAQIAPGNPEEFLRLLTEADSRLLEWVKFRWTREKVTLTPEDGIVTLPADFAAIIACQVGGLPVDIKDDMFEYVPGGVGEVEVGGSDGIRLIDQGIDDYVLSESSVPTLTVTGSLTDGTSPVVFPTLYSYGTAGNFSSDGGSEAPADGSWYEYTVGAAVGGFPPDTVALRKFVNGVVTAEWEGIYDADPENVTSIAPFEPATGTPVFTVSEANYPITEPRRQYKVTGTLPTGTTLRAWLHYAPATLYDPDIADSTLTSDATTNTRCPSLAALKLAMLGIIMEEANDIDASGKYFATALRNLDSKESTNRGGAVPKVNTRRGGGMRKIRNLR